MAPSTTHTVHTLSVLRGLDSAISNRLPGTRVISARTHDFGLNGEVKKRFFRKLTDEELDRLAEAEILVADSPALTQALKRRGLDLFPRLRWVHTTSAGIDNVLQAIGSEPPFIVTRSTDEAAPTLITQYVVGQILCHERRWLHTYLKQVNKDFTEWTHFQEYRSLTQLTVGVMGVGNMGLATVKALKGFGCRVYGLARVPRSPASAVPGVDQLWYGRESLAAFLRECDYVVNTLPSTPATRGMLGGDVLCSAARKPVLVNVGRGDIISEADLIRALEQGWLSAALLDCTEKEPLPEDSPLWTHPRVVVTPHTSTMSSNDLRVENTTSNFCDNFAKFLTGEPLDGRVDWQAGY